MNQVSKGYFPLVVFVIALAMATMKCNMTNTAGTPGAISPEESDDNSLKSLTMSGNGSWDREFEPEVLNYTYTVKNTVELITLTPRANSKKSKITINDEGCRSNEKSLPISLEAGSKNEILIQVTAENGDVREYTVIVERMAPKEEKDDDAALISLTISGASLQPDFNPETFKYAVSIPETKIPLDVTAVARSAKARINFKLDGDPVENQHEIHFTGAKATLVAEVTAGDGSTKKIYIIAITRSVGPSRISSDLKGIEIAFGKKNSRRPIYHSFNEPKKTTFDPAITDYAAVVYACTSITLTVTADDPSVKSIVFNDNTDGTHTNGVKTGTVKLTAGIGMVTKVTISVTGRGGSAVKKYNLEVKLLNSDEFIFGIYGQSNARSFLRWMKIVPNPGPGTNKTIKGYASGKLEWWVQVVFLRGKNNMRMTNYSDGNDNQGSTELYTPYNDNTGINSQDGFVVNGTTVGDVNLQGNGLQTGTYYLTTPWGDPIGSIDFHVYLENKWPVTKKGSGSYMIFTYMGGKYRYSDLEDTRDPEKLPYPFTPDYNWYESWKREK